MKKHEKKEPFWGFSTKKINKHLLNTNIWTQGNFFFAVDIHEDIVSVTYKPVNKKYVSSICFFFSFFSKENKDVSNTNGNNKKKNHYTLKLPTIIRNKL